MISIPVKELITWSSKFKNKHELDFIPIEFDKEVKDYLWELGIDYHKGYCLTANLLRDPIDKTKRYVGLRYVGEIRTDKEYTLSSRCSAFDRIVIASKESRFSCFSELVQLSQTSLSLGTFSDTDEMKQHGISDSDIDEDFDKNTEAIAKLNMIILNMRGYPYNEYGNLKTYKEWQESESIACKI